MAETSYPTAGGGSVTDANYEVLMASATGDGLIGRPSFSALVYGDSSGRQVKVRGSRGAIVRGFRWQTDSAGLTVPITSNSSGQTRLDLVVLRLNRTNYTVRVAVLAGTPSSSPTTPSPLMQDAPAQYFDLPLARVTVRTGTTILGAGDVEEYTWYLAEPMVVGKSNYTPPSVPGRMFWQYDSRALWVANSSGGYDNVQRDSGWVTVPLASGWTANQGVKVRRKGDTVFLNVSVVRSGATVASNVDSTIATISTASMRPDGLSPDGVFHCSNPDHSSDFYVNQSTGQIVLNANNTHAINQNAYIWGSISYPITG